jgi:hypothetical protein
MPTISTTIDVDVDLDQFDTDDLIDELESRGEVFQTESTSILEEIYHLRRQNLDYQHKLDELIYEVLGKIV